MVHEPVALFHPLPEIILLFLVRGTGGVQATQQKQCSLVVDLLCELHGWVFVFGMGFGL